MDFKPMTRFRIVTLGCKVNQYESAWLREALCAEGWEWAGQGFADVTIVNTCIVTQTASRQSRQEIRKAIRRSPEGLVAAVGCYGQVFPEELMQIKGIGLIVGNSRKGAVVDLLKGALDGTDHEILVSGGFGSAARFDAMPVSRFSGRSRAFLKIQDGCESFCSYCIVPFARGPSRSLAMKEVLEGVERYCRAGYREIVLTGIHLGLYSGGEAGCSLVGLLKRIRSEKYPARIRLSSMEPNEITGEIIEMVAEGGWICRHLHIALQSGDDSILSSMNRRYTADDFAWLVQKIHETCPQSCIGADVMCGFPGENGQTFENTRSLLAGLPVSYLHVFRYSRRPGTRAAEFPLQVPPGEVKKMAEVMRALGRGKRSEFNRASLGNTLEVLREGRLPSKENMALGTSDNYVPVVFRFQSENDPDPLLKIRAEQIKDDKVEGTIVSASYPG
ncbi:MAG TPA: tRNA (N(6)-L-threonylcarbamoyladenosine(37)-C(2))-methylthiotransferase MtaB [Desulfobacteraceae bacterium]|nr:tRNA (N(6)-L-threonylcarbamoyladenosine(37)-C(2))-methylthiotransferase MtaB [Desulfobacteraceae bacterium]